METNFNFKSAICTSREQSERLLALGLKKETADFYTPLKLNPDKGSLPCPPDFWTSDEPFIKKVREASIPAWSLYRLIEMLPKNTIVNIDMVFPFRRTALSDLIDNDCDLYEGLVQVIERSVKEGYFYNKYLDGIKKEQD